MVCLCDRLFTVYFHIKIVNKAFIFIHACYNTEGKKNPIKLLET